VVSQHVTPPDIDVWATDVMWDVVGLGSLYLLDTEVEKEFNEMVGMRHGVPVGTMRTYLPGVNLDDHNDPQRHQILGRTRIEWTEPRRLSRIIGHAQRERAAQAVLPAEVLKLDERLSEGCTAPARNLRAVEPLNVVS